MNDMSYVWPASIIAVAAAAIAAGVIWGVYAGLKKADKGKKEHNGTGPEEGQTDSLKPWSTLLENQILRDCLKVGDILQWIETIRKEFQEDEVIFLYKANQAQVEQLGYEYDGRVKPENNIIACVQNKSTGVFSHAQLFSFGEFEKEAAELFAGQDYAVITL